MARLGWVGCGAVNCGWVDYGEARGGGALCKGGGSLRSLIQYCVGTYYMQYHTGTNNMQYNTGTYPILLRLIIR